MNIFIEIPVNNLSLAMRKLVFGIGVNDADYLTYQTINGKMTRCHYYSTWKDMLRRCYSTKTHEIRPTYIGCSVCEEWLLFSNFKNWMKKQDWEGKKLDKDLLIKGNKVYSPKTCLFITREINLLFTDSKAKRGAHPIGVCWHKRDKVFQASCSVNGRVKAIGSFDSELEASNAYQSFKNNLIFEMASKQSNPILKDALLKRIG